MLLIRKSLAIASILGTLSTGALTASFAAPSHGFSPFSSTLKLPPSFTHFDYANDQAPQGGTIVYGVLGTFDSLNPYIVMGTAAGGLLFLTTAQLLSENHNAPGEAYGYGAETIDLADDGLSVTYKMRQGMTFSNGDPITIEDIIWSFEVLKEKGLPNYRTYYNNITAATKISDTELKFTFNTQQDKELPLILGQIPLLNKKFYETVPFDKSSLAIPPSSGPYVVDKIEPGRSITYKRNRSWWGNSVPSQRGLYNFDFIKFEYFLDSTALFEAFKAGKVDIRVEATIKNWMTGYDIPAVKDGHILRKEFSHNLSSGTYGLFFNTRRAIFQDVTVRKALTYAFDFQWLNKNIFYSQYTRNQSYYPNSDFEASGPPSAAELALLAPYKELLPKTVLSAEFKLPFYKTEAEKREGLATAKKLLEEAGYYFHQNQMVHKTTKTILTFEILLTDKSHEKIILPYVKNLEHIGVLVKVRTIDSASYMNLVEHNNFDMIFTSIPQSASLGNEQRTFFGSKQADTVGTYNYAGIKNRVVDELIESLIMAPSYEDLTLRAKALDRVLLFNYYMIPAWHSSSTKVAYWSQFDFPETMPKYAPFYFFNWWVKPVSTSPTSSQKS